MNEPIEYRHAPAGADRTLRAMLATDLMIVPLWALFTNHGWLGDVWFATAIVCVPAAIIRAFHPPRVWHTWLGVVLLVPWLTARFVNAHAIAGFVPSGATLSDVGNLFDAVRKLSNDGVAPVHETMPVSFVLALLGGLLAAFVDLIAVVGRRAAIAGVPALIIYTVAGAVTRHPVAWQLFIASAASFLVLLSIDAADTVRSWGRVVHKGSENRSVTALGVSGTRIAIIAIVIAALVPAVAPARTRNLLANVVHNGTGGPVSGGFGAGAGSAALEPFVALHGDLARSKPITLFTVTVPPGNVSPFYVRANVVHNGNGGPVSGGFGAGAGSAALEPFVALHGDLVRSKPITLFTVTVPPGNVSPFYVRANVLSSYTAQGWQVSTHDGQVSVANTDFGAQPPSSSALTTVGYSARFVIAGLVDNPPVFADPTKVTGVDDQVNWSAADQILTGTRTHRGQVIDENIVQPEPSTSELTNAPEFDAAALARWLALPKRMPKQVVDEVNTLTNGVTGEYYRARALTDFFTAPSNGFVYSLSTVPGDSGSDLVDFLTNRRGYCQQFAGALAVMMRLAGVPARVVLGYAHAAPDARGKFAVTTTNAHAWVEAYFQGLGWIPFDPTPLAGAQGGATLQLPWAPHTTATAAANATTGSLGALSVGPKSATASSTPTSAATHDNGRSVPISAGALIVIGIVVLVACMLLLPAMVRAARRRRRLHAARKGDPDPLWAELSDTARDLGYVWSPARSPRQVAAWLGGDGAAPDPLRTLAGAVERARYSADAPPSTSLVTELRQVEARLRAQQRRTTRVRARLLPASLGWRIRAPRRRGH